MKGIRNFLLIVGGMAILMFIGYLFTPREFDWEPTLSPSSSEPYGTKLFDEVVSRTVKQGYEVNNRSFYELLTKDSLTDTAILVISYDLSAMSKATSEHLIKLVQQGNRVMLVTNDIGIYLPGETGIECSNYLQQKELPSFMKDGPELSLVEWKGNDPFFKPRNYMVEIQMHYTKLHVDSEATDTTALAGNGLTGDEEAFVAVRQKIGNGELFIVSMPLLFTNYGILQPGNAELIFRLLSQLGPRHIIRTTRYAYEEDEEDDMLGFIKSQPPLRWAYYLTLLFVLIFMLTTARRRCRAIPVVTAPRNHALEFTKLIGTLYYQQHNYADLVCKKYVYTAEQLRRLLDVNITDPAEDTRSFAIIARNTGLDEAEVGKTIKAVRSLAAQSRDISAGEMKQLIDKLNALSPP